MAALQYGERRSRRHLVDIRHKNPNHGTRRLRPVIQITAAFFALTVLGCGQNSVSGEQTDRQATVAARGATVMPFNLDRTLHDFQPLDAGGLQVVTARDPNDADEIAAIREHLRMEAERFQAGDFSDPAAIHGDDMPGLAALQAGAEHITIQYAERVDGAEIRYSTDDPTLVAAIHDWFKAQTSDHGEHSIHH
jgi:hypothetical protein